MKKIMAAVLMGLVSAHLAMAQATQVKITARYEGIDPSFIKDIQVTEPTFMLPKVTTKSGGTAVIRIVREYSVPKLTKEVDTGTDFDARNAGATLTILPVIKGNEIAVKGSNELRRKDDAAAAGSTLTPISFTTEETFFEGTVQPGKPVTVKLSKGQLVLLFTLVDQEGKAVGGN